MTRQTRGITRDAFGKLEPGHSLARHVRQDGAAVIKLATAHVLAVEVNEIEGDELGPRGALAGARGVEGEKVRGAVLADSDGLPSITALRTFKALRARAILGMRSAQLCPRRV
ncbi:MAG: hypothetical protein WA813_13060 [Beijerinckiaceae bacterium]